MNKVLEYNLSSKLLRVARNRVISQKTKDRGERCIQRLLKVTLTAVSLSSMPIKSQSTVDSSGGTCIEDDAPEVKVSSLSCPDCEYIVTDIK